MNARKWHPDREEYLDYTLPENSRIVADLEATISCAACGKKLLYGLCYTSKQIHNNSGFGYAVCRMCYEKECDEERKWKK